MTVRLLFVLIPIGVLLAALSTTASALCWRARHTSGAVIELRAAAGSKLDLETWAVFYRSLHGIVRPRWKERLLGQPGSPTSCTARTGR